MNSTRKRVDEFTTAVAVQYGERLRRYLRKRLRRADDLDDLSQEVYLRLLRIRDASLLSNVREPMAYVYRVAANVLADWNDASDQCIERAIDLDSAVDQVEACTSTTTLDDAADCAARQQDLEHLERILRSLPPVQAAVVLLLDRDGFTYEEVAAKLNLSVGAVHWHIKNARARIRLSTWVKGG